MFVFYLDYPSVDIETKVILNNVENIDEEKAKKFSIFSNFVRSLGLNNPFFNRISWMGKIQSFKWWGIFKFKYRNSYKDIEDQKIYLDKIKEDNANKTNELINFLIMFREFIKISIWKK